MSPASARITITAIAAPAIARKSLSRVRGARVVGVGRVGEAGPSIMADT
jgi:chorismate synthase